MDPLEPGTLPEEYEYPAIMKVKSDMFEGPNGLPKFLKQMGSESDEKYEKRVSNFLMCMSSEQFGAIGMKLDPEDES